MHLADKDKSTKGQQPAPEGKPRKVKAARMVKKTTYRNKPRKAQTLSGVAVEKRRGNAVYPGLLYYTWLFLYKNLYLLGITLLRRGLRIRRRIRMGFSRLRGRSYALLHQLRQFVSRVYRELLQRMRAPFHRIVDTYQQQKPLIASQKAVGKFPLLAYLPVWEMVGRLVFKVLSTIFNYGAPVLAAVLLFTYVGERLNQPVALRLEYEGHDMGYVRNESVFDEATQIIRDRIIDQSTQDVTFGIPSFQLDEVSVDQMLDSSELADMIIRVSGSDYEEAYGLWVNNTFLGAVDDKDAVLDKLDEIREECSIGKPGERVEFVKPIRLSRELYPASSIRDTEELVNRLGEAEQGEDTYTVQEGDTPTEIADKNNMQYETLKALNPTIEEDLKPGMVLRTRAARPFLPLKNIYIDTYEEEIPFERVEVQNATYAKGYEEITQEGANGLRLVTAEITLVNGQETDRTILDDSKIIRNAISERVVIGINDPVAAPSYDSGQTGGTSEAPSNYDTTPSGAAAGSSGFIWPTVGGRASTYRGHTGNGIDIAPGGAGHPIYAAKAGVVAKVVNGYTGYGHYIIIDHQDGFQTLYAHHSANLVSQGDWVEQGQVIALMGRTGWATGNHLHFEVRLNGRFMWPPDYVGYSG